jgi:hypothetical protein
MDTQSNLPENIGYQQSFDKIIKTYPIYYKIFESYYSGGKNVTDELNRLYKPIFTGLIEYYTEFMDVGIVEIIDQIKCKYNPEKPYALIDYIEFIYGNIFYETFLYEIKKINLSTVRYEHLCVFEYIIKVELIKYKLYLETIDKIEPGSKLLLAMSHRLENCYKKISFCLGYLEKNYPEHNDIIMLSNQMVSSAGIETKIDKSIVSSISSFMEINKKK